MAEENNEDETTEETEDQSEESEGESEEESNESEDSDEDSKEDANSDVDWKKVADEETDRRTKAEKALADKRYKSKHTKSRQDDSEDADTEDPEEEKPLTQSELERILARERQETTKVVLTGRVKEIAASLSESDEEASAIVAIFNNRSFPESMSIEDQVREAYYIAHGPRLVAKQSELRRSLRSKETKKPTGSENAHRDETKASPKGIDPQTKGELARLGFKWDGKNYSKKLAGGKTLVRDPKLKKTYLLS